MGTRTLLSSIFLGIALCVTGARAISADVQQPPATPPATAEQAAPAAVPAEAAGYAWADACKSCHADIYAAWARTKHSTALNRLSGSDQEKDCIGCHVTGPKTRIMDGRKVLNAGVQCESCHGHAAAHAADATVKTGLIRKPSEDSCKECHSDKSPHFRGFFYGAMAPIVHKVK